MASTLPIPVVVLTGHADDPIWRWRPCGAGPTTSSPRARPAAGELARAIRYAIERHEMQRHASAQLLHQAALHQLEMSGSAAADLQGFAQAAASAVQMGLDAPRVSIFLEGEALPGTAAATAVREQHEAAGEGDSTAVVVELRADDGGGTGRLEVLPPRDTGLTADQRRFVTTAAASITARVDRLVANLELSARTRQLDTVQRVAEDLQRHRHPDDAVAGVAELLLKGLEGDGVLGVCVEVEDTTAQVGEADVPGGVVAAAPVTVRGAVLGSIALLRDAGHAQGARGPTVLERSRRPAGHLVGAGPRRPRAPSRPGPHLPADGDGARWGWRWSTPTDGSGSPTPPRWSWSASTTSTRSPGGSTRGASAPWSPPLVAVARVRTTGRPVRDVRVALPQVDGAERVLAVNASPLSPGPGGDRGHGALAHDVTAERRRAVLLESALDREQRGGRGAASGRRAQGRVPAGPEPRAADTAGGDRRASSRRCGTTATNSMPTRPGMLDRL